MLRQNPAGSWPSHCLRREDIMSTLLPCVSILAVGCFMFVSSAQAVLRVGNTSGICPNTCVAAPPCTHCGVLRVKRSGDADVVNPQSLPPKIYFHGRPSHR
jgi:hypothetical protein